MKRKIIYTVSFLCALIVLRIFLFEVYAVSQNSMRNTYETGNRVLIIKNFYSIKINDVLVFKHGNQNVIKRCVGLPGDTLKITQGIISSNSAEIPPSSKAIFKIKSEVDVITRSNIYYTYSNDWTPYNMGPYIVPKKGMKILLSPENVSLYGSLIKNDCSSSRQSRNEIEKEKSFYVFQHDYFFLVGDNRIESTDSRVFGPIKKSDIKGRVIYNF